jgi:hypothetical protein
MRPVLLEQPEVVGAGLHVHCSPSKMLLEIRRNTISFAIQSLRLNNGAYNLSLEEMEIGLV